MKTNETNTTDVMKLTNETLESADRVLMDEFYSNVSNYKSTKTSNQLLIQLLIANITKIKHSPALPEWRQWKLPALPS